MLALSPLVLQLIQLGVSLAPEVISAARTEIDLLNAGADPTAEQQAAIDSALEASHTALQSLRA